MAVTVAVGGRTFVAMDTDYVSFDNWMNVGGSDTLEIDELNQRKMSIARSAVQYYWDNPLTREDL